MTRKDGRTTDQLRPVTIERGWSAHAEGSALITFGGTFPASLQRIKTPRRSSCSRSSSVHSS